MWYGVAKKSQAALQYIRNSCISCYANNSLRTKTDCSRWYYTSAPKIFLSSSSLSTRLHAPGEHSSENKILYQIVLLYILLYNRSNIKGKICFIYVVTSLLLQRALYKIYLKEQKTYIGLTHTGTADYLINYFAVPPSAGTLLWLVKCQVPL